VQDPSWSGGRDDDDAWVCCNRQRSTLHEVHTLDMLDTLAAVIAMRTAHRFTAAVWRLMDAWRD